MTTWMCKRNSRFAHQPTPTTSMADDDQQRQLARQEEELDLNELDQDDVLEVVEDDGEMMEPGSDDEGGDDAGAPADEDEEDEAERLIAEHSLDDSVATYRASKDAVFAVDVHPSPEAQLAVSGGADDQAHIWSTATGALVADLTGHTDSVTSVRFSRHDNGQFVATAGMDGRVRFWRRKAPGWQTWEFLTSLEGPEEVNVRLCAVPLRVLFACSPLARHSGSTGIPRAQPCWQAAQTAWSGSGSVRHFCPLPNATHELIEGGP